MLWELHSTCCATTLPFETTCHVASGICQVVDVWPFEDPEDTVVFTTHYVLDLAQPIVRVVRDREDGAWQVHASAGTSNAEPRLVALGEIAEMDATFLELADLPRGWVATRESPSDPWRRSRR